MQCNLMVNEIARPGGTDMSICRIAGCACQFLTTSYPMTFFFFTIIIIIFYAFVLFLFLFLFLFFCFPFVLFCVFVLDFCLFVLFVFVFLFVCLFRFLFCFVLFWFGCFLLLDHPGIFKHMVGNEACTAQVKVGSQNDFFFLKFERLGNKFLLNVCFGSRNLGKNRRKFGLSNVSRD